MEVGPYGHGLGHSGVAVQSERFTLPLLFYIRIHIRNYYGTINDGTTCSTLFMLRCMQIYYGNQIFYYYYYCYIPKRLLIKK